MKVPITPASSAMRCIWAALLIAIVLHGVQKPCSAAEAAYNCPGVVGAACRRQCQIHLCEALAQLYKVSNNASDPWDNEQGWHNTTTAPCTSLVAAQGQSQLAAYCSWYGVMCCTPAAVAAGNCTVINTVSGLDMPMNNLNVSLANTAFLSALQQLHDCGMTDMDLEANNLSGEMHDQEWSKMVNLRVIDFANSWIEGPIPSALRRMRNLTRINLSNSYMYGTIPEWIGEFEHLELLNLGTLAGVNYESGLKGTIPSQVGKLRKLRGLILESNYLTGTLPPELCQGADKNSLLLVNLRANSLTGSARVLEGCGNLVQLDISRNSFVGQLPASTMWDELTTYQASYNNFTGEFPCTLCHNAQILETLDISHNQIKGQIPNSVTLLSGLKTLSIGNNQFTGTLTENIYYLPGLKMLDISNNKFVGTIQNAAVQYPYALTTADFSNNTGFTGILPPQMGFLPNLQKVRTTGTSMSCSGATRSYNITTNASCNDPMRCTAPILVSGTDEAARRCSEAELLPCFLRFSDDSLPREDASNMRCKLIMRKTPEQAKADCAGGSGMYTLGADAEFLPDIYKDSTEQTWIIDPAYFQYRECTCLQGYSPIWSANDTVLQCVETSAVGKRTIIVVSAISAVAGLALLAVLVLLAQLYLRTRPKWLRERIMQGRRMQGAPTCSKPGDKARVSIVVTDVKDFSALTGQYHELMMKAMGAHNNILRKACHTHAGYVIDQEGDSWTVAFHEPQDAVAFSLQVQQALSQKVWGVRLPADNSLEHPEPVRSDPSGFSSFSRTKSMTQSPGLGLSSAGVTGGILPRFQQPTNPQHAGLTGAADSAEVAAAGPRHSQDVASGLHSHAGAAAKDPAVITAAAAPQNDAQQHEDCQVAPRSRSFINPLGASFTSSVGRSSISGIESIQQSFTEFAGHSASRLGRIFGRRSGSRTSKERDTGVQLRRQQHSDTDPLPQLHGASQVPGQLASARDGISDPLPASSGHHVVHMGSQTVSESVLRLGSQTLTEDGHPGIGRIGSSTSSHRQQSTDRDVEYGTTASSWAVGRSSSSFGSGISAYDRVVGSFTGKVDRAFGGSFTSSGRRRSTASAFMQRFGQMTAKGAAGGPDPPHVKLLRLAVRVGIASGPLPHGVFLGNCAVKHRAKRIISEAAAGGQVLVDESTFLSIKDSLSVLGTVNEAGYDDQLLQQLMHAQVVGRLQRQVVCAGSPCLRPCDQQRQLSFTGGLWGREPQDYDNDAIAVHMGCFEVPNAPVDDLTGSNSSSESNSPTSHSGELELVDLRGNSTSAASSGPYRCTRQKLHLYSIASPGMRRPPEHRERLGFHEEQLGWAEPVSLRPGWVQTQRGYFEAPSACQMDLTPGSHLAESSQAALSEVTVVFVSVAGAPSFTAKHTQKELHAVNKAIIKCMLQQINSLHGRDGYLCRCQEPDLRYMVAFEHPHNAVQWCLLVQEALMYVSWGDNVMSHPGFEEELCPATGRLLFRGPRLRMGLAEGPPNSVLPDHNGRANYYGGSVNAAARYMDAAAHGGQIVTDIELCRKVLRDWNHERGASGRDGLPASPPLQDVCIGGLTTIHSVIKERSELRGSVIGSTGQAFAASEGSIGGSTCDASIDTDQQQTQQDLSNQQQQDPLMQQLVKRSASETTARSQVFGSRRNLLPLQRHTEDGTPGSLGLTVRCKSFTEDMPASSLGAGHQRSAEMQGLFEAAAADAAPILEKVHVQHLGRFSFKGSGEYDMVQLLHAAIADRTFPQEPPKGKGQRLTPADPGLVTDLESVRLKIPPAVAAARQAYKLLQY